MSGARPTCNCHLQDCSFHPSEDLIAAGIITGQVRVSECNGTSAARRSQKRLHSESCRAVQFSSRGDFLLTGSADKSVVVLDTATCKVQRTHQDAHPAGVSRLVALSESTFASGKQFFGCSCNIACSTRDMQMMPIIHATCCGALEMAAVQLCMHVIQGMMMA